MLRDVIKVTYPISTHSQSLAFSTPSTSAHPVSNPFSCRVYVHAKAQPTTPQPSQRRRVTFLEAAGG